jgi:hypothetical protein
MSERHVSADVVTQDIRMECVDAEGIVTTVDAMLGYHSADPYAVTATFPTATGDVVWTFARELLSRGLTHPADAGDVHIWPFLDDHSRSTVIIELCSRYGELVAQAPTQDISRFVRRSLAAVPAGTESDHIDVDGLINQLLHSERN